MDDAGFLTLDIPMLHDASSTRSKAPVLHIDMFFLRKTSLYAKRMQADIKELRAGLDALSQAVQKNTKDIEVERTHKAAQAATLSGRDNHAQQAVAHPPAILRPVPDHHRHTDKEE